MTDFAVWSDFRGVLTPPLAEGVRTFCAGREFTPAQLMASLRAIGRRHGQRDGMAVLDSGILDERRWTREIERELAANHGVRTDLSNFGADWWRDRRVDEDWVAAVASWRDRGIFVGLMSNLPVDWKAGFAAFADFDALFDDVVLSCDVGARKPDPAIFEAARARSGVAPRHTVLADDLADNVAGARRAGWHGVLVSHDDTGTDAVGEVESFLGLAKGVLR
jgi:putative hydrolase of the HAD superfamily